MSHSRVLVAILPLVVAAFVLAACGGGSGGDEEYVRDVCKAVSEFSAGIEKAVKTSGTTGTAGASFSQFVEPFDRLAKDFGDADPPSDLEQWHNDTAKKLRDVADQLRKTKDFNAVAGLNTDPLSNPPEAARDRLRAVAKKTKECQGVTVFQ